MVKDEVRLEFMANFISFIDMSINWFHGLVASDMVLFFMVPPADTVWSHDSSTAMSQGRASEAAMVLVLARFGTPNGVPVSARPVRESLNRIPSL